MTCVNCGAELKDGAKFCAKCGTKAEAPAPAEVPMILVCGKCQAPLKEGAKFCAKCGAGAAEAKSVPAPPEKPSPAPVAPDTAAAMTHMTSDVNPWEYDFPAFFETLDMTFTETTEETRMSRESPAYAFGVSKVLVGTKPAGLFAKQLNSLSDFIELMMNAWSNPTVLEKKDTVIHGIKAVYCNLNFGGHSYLKVTFMEKEGFFYVSQIQVPYAEKEKHEEVMDAFINSVKIKDK